ncbi:MAG TPA: hypothetical protein VKA48_11380 [Gammaproteobacteria bacterium]|nr:hypothetical protein [Gammaproteobacteria bacterium]
MLYLQAQVLNTFTTPEGVNRDTGEAYGGQHRVQLLYKDTMRNGETRMQPVDLNTQQPGSYEVGAQVMVPVRVFSPPQGGVRFAEAGPPEPVKGA